MLLRFAVIGGIVVIAGAAFAYTGGWLSPDRLSPTRIVDALSKRGGDPVGHRRNHAKGICFTGTFAANGQGAALSKAAVFAAGTYPVTGRFAIAVADPAAADITGRVRSMAVRIVAPDGQEWRTGMNAMPVFPVATVKAFYDLTVATDIDPATGKPDPKAVPAFVGQHPEMKPFLAWATTAPWTASYGEDSFNSLNAFRFTNAAGQTQAVRWTMQSETPATTVDPGDLAKRGPDFLEQDLVKRLAAGPLKWKLVVTVADPGDPVNDPTQAWPAGRKQVDVGTMTIDKAEPEANGPCRDINYDPLVLADGMAPSDDPILLARSPAYAKSFRLRESESAAYPRTPANPGDKS